MGQQMGFAALPYAQYALETSASMAFSKCHAGKPIAIHSPLSTHDGGSRSLCSGDKRPRSHTQSLCSCSPKSDGSSEVVCKYAGGMGANSVNGGGRQGQPTNDDKQQRNAHAPRKSRASRTRRKPGCSGAAAVSRDSRPFVRGRACSPLEAIPACRWVCDVRLPVFRRWHRRRRRRRASCGRK